MADEKILKEEELSQDQLDGVAGGSNWQNEDLLRMMLEIDPGETRKFLQTWDQKGPNAKIELRDGMKKLLQNYVNDAGLNISFDLTASANDNRYYINGKQVNHEVFKNYLNPAL